MTLRKLFLLVGLGGLVAALLVWGALLVVLGRHGVLVLPMLWLL